MKPGFTLAAVKPGFTLLEVLIALVVFGLLLTGLVQGTQFGMDAWGRQAQRVAAQQDLDAVERTLRHLVATMDPGNRSIGPPNFTGNRRSMGFTAALPDSLPDTVATFGARQGDVVLDVDPAHRLMLRWAPHFATLIGPPPPPQVTPLLDGVDHLDLAYWTPPGAWRDAWTSDTLPRLVRITLVFVPGDPRRWPPILAEVQTKP